MDPLEMMEKVAVLMERGGLDGTFAGGTVLALYVDDVSREDLRPTQDVDVIVYADSYGAYQAECRKLMRVGFEPGREDGDPLCRYRGAGLIVDLMPTPYKGMGTDNPWFGLATETAEWVELPGGTQVRIVSAPVYLATKVTAFEGRGRGDLLMSKDFEDIVALVDGREHLVAEVEKAPGSLRVFVAKWCEELLRERWLSDAVAGHVSRASGPGRIDVVMSRLRELANLAPKHG
ncbi:MAG: nucleotidyl transferase AbiEii/AbiGii toxin family protein [Oligoflexia bacterium]|nr:nucleotidyl transferase AbiEii/AbiGii toxin family protein [Oligoflexia bacterium]